MRKFGYSLSSLKQIRRRLWAQLRSRSECRSAQSNRAVDTVEMAALSSTRHFAGSVFKGSRHHDDSTRGRQHEHQSNPSTTWAYCQETRSASGQESRKHAAHGPFTIRAEGGSIVWSTAVATGRQQCAALHQQQQQQHPQGLRPRGGDVRAAAAGATPSRTGSPPGCGCYPGSGAPAWCALAMCITARARPAAAALRQQPSLL